MAVDCTGWLEPLELECLLMNTFAGSIEIFMFVALIAIGIVGTSLRMINVTLLVMYGLFSIIMAQYFEGMFFLTVLIAGLVITFGIGKLAKI
jgi:hypothetical protein